MPLRLAIMLKRSIADKVNKSTGFKHPSFFTRIKMTEPQSDFLDNLAAKQHEKLIREVAGDYKNTDEEEGPQDLSE
jgi:hypothetical protein